MTGQEPKSIMRSLGEFVGHVAKGIRTDPSAPKTTEVRREVETERRGDVVLRRTTIEEVEIQESHGVGSAVFVVKRGSKAGTRYSVTETFTTIGRHPESDIFLDDVTVSRRHAAVHRDGDAVLLNDAGSLNGTYLNRTRIESSSLRSGDEVQIGKFKLVLTLISGLSGRVQPHINNTT